jgi:hypothetical protein
MAASSWHHLHHAVTIGRCAHCLEPCLEEADCLVDLIPRIPHPSRRLLVDSYISTIFSLVAVFFSSVRNKCLLLLFLFFGLSFRLFFGLSFRLFFRL